AARAAGQRVAVHLEVDTGMARQGAAVGAELAKTLERLAGSRWVSCEGLMTHLCCSEVFEGKRTASQREKFVEALEQALAAGVKPAFLHVGNSSAVDEGSTMSWLRETAKKLGAKAMVRTGFAIFGHCLPISGGEGEDCAGALASRLKPVMTWKTRIIGLRELEAGASVGYGATFVAKKRMRLALLPVGYADGFRRAASSGEGDDWVKGWVRIAGKVAAVVGRVSMNLMVVDVTEIGEAVVGGEVVLLGDGVTAEDHAEWSGTIAYDILCGIRANFELR
ncbi:MAG: alanine racemase, partial [Acidobacteriota bacterium]